MRAVTTAVKSYEFDRVSVSNIVLGRHLNSFNCIVEHDNFKMVLTNTARASGQMAEERLRGLLQAKEQAIHADLRRIEEYRGRYWFSYDNMSLISRGSSCRESRAYSEYANNAS